VRVEEGAVVNLRQYVAVLLLPAAAIAALIWIEGSFAPPAIAVSLSGLNEAQKQALSFTQDLAKFFTSFAVSIIGVVAFYLKLDRDIHRPRSAYAVVLIADAIVCAILSVFFGHLWMAKLRGQLVVNILDLQASELVWPERLQYIFFLTSLIWSAMLVVDRETTKSESLEVTVPMSGLLK
jgi:hypothetical protein